jgi:pimeloyl-ACP methyl ester carboxylesterase
MSAAPSAKPALTQPAPWAFAAPWGARGYVSDLDGPVHWIEFGEEGMLPGAGHTPQLEVPDSVIGTVRDWLGRTTPGTH